MRTEYNYKIKPLLEAIDQSGDLIFIKEEDEFCYMGVIDALGHGTEANHAALLAVNFLEQNYTMDPAQDIVRLHSVLKNSRGAVIGLSCFNKNSGELTYSGVGNITTRIIGSEPTKLVYRDGIVGFSIPKICNKVTRIFPGDIILSYSDGVKENFDMLDLPDLRRESAENITTILLDRYSKNNDDASVLTIKVMYD